MSLSCLPCLFTGLKWETTKKCIQSLVRQSSGLSCKVKKIKNSSCKGSQFVVNHVWIKKTKHDNSHQRELVLLSCWSKSKCLMIVLFYNDFLARVAWEIVSSAIFHLLKLFSLSVRRCRPWFSLFWRIQNIRSMFILYFLNQRENQSWGRGIRQMGTRRAAARD